MKPVSQQNPIIIQYRNAAHGLCQESDILYNFKGETQHELEIKVASFRFQVGK
jgi:hypothetical protein